MENKKDEFKEYVKELVKPIFDKFDSPQETKTDKKDIIEVEKKGLKLPIINPKLTTAQKVILHLITDEFLTIKQIAQRRNCSIQAVYKIIAQIKKKGVLGNGLNKVEKVESTFNQSDVRLHGQEFNIRILWQDNKYQELLEKSNVIFIDSNTIRLYKNSIEIYSGQSFYGNTANISENKSLSYWQGFLARLEHDLKVLLIKTRARNIKIVNQHYARGNSEIADDSVKNRERVWVYAEEDGKLAFITDDSFGFREDETVHPITAKIDRKAVDKQVNDWRLNNPPTNSELKESLIIQSNNVDKLTNNQLKQAEQISEFAIALNRHIPAYEKMGNFTEQLVKEFKLLRKDFKSVKSENQSLKLKIKHQKSIFDFK